MRFDVMLAPCYPLDALIIQAETRSHAQTILATQGYELGIMAFRMRLNFLSIDYPYSQKPIKIKTEEIIKDYMENTTISNIPGLFLGETKIYTRQFLLVLLDLCDRKDENAGLVRLSDNKQLILTSGASMGLEDPTPLTQLHREDYWNLEDLTEFNREWRQILRDDGTNSCTFSYRRLIDPLNPNSGWERQTTRYNLFVDGSELYHRASFVDAVALR